MMAAFAMLTIIMAFGITDPWVILAFSFLDGCGYRSQRSRLASVHWRYLERRHLPAAVTLLNVGFNTVRSVGWRDCCRSLWTAYHVALTTLSFAAPLTVLWRNNWKVKSSSL